MYIISACLAGVHCRYDGKDNLIAGIEKLVKEGKAVLACPEQLGGLPTPREPAEIIEGEDGEIKVINKLGQDVTENFEKGAKEALRLAEMVNADSAILKARSPSCGFGKIYDGTFTGIKKDGNGLTAELLVNNGFKIYSEENLPKELLDLDNKDTDPKKEG